MNKDGHCRDGIKENAKTEVPARLVQVVWAGTSCVIRMHEMNMNVFLMRRAGGVPSRRQASLAGVLILISPFREKSRQCSRCSQGGRTDVGQVIGQFVLAILESLAELFCFFTGKWLLLLITGGRVVPMPPTTPRSWSLSPFKRLPTGQLGVDSQFVALIALVFWILVGIGLHLLFR